MHATLRSPSRFRQHFVETRLPPTQGAEAAVAVVSTQVNGQSKWRPVAWFADPENSGDFNAAKNILSLGLDTGELPRDEDRTTRASGQAEKAGLRVGKFGRS